VFESPQAHLRNPAAAGFSLFGALSPLLVVRTR
jgi:hypothetical protein